MNYVPPPQKPETSQLYDSLGQQYADDMLKLRQIKQRENARYDVPKAPGKKVFTGGPMNDIRI